MSDLTISPEAEPHSRGDAPPGDALIQGPEITAAGVRYRTWTEHPSPTLIIYREDGTVVRSLNMESQSGGFFSVLDEYGQPGDLYKYQFGGTATFPDPASRYQPQGVHGPSMVMGNQFRWNDNDWEPAHLSDLTIYELHIGTFTAEGTFSAATEKLPALADLGVTAIEIMPIADFPGARNWGYDGVCVYAPARIYGTPDELRRLIDTAHALGLTVVLDVVYNHFGPAGNYLAAFHRQYFHPTHKTPWGSAFNFELAAVRYFFLQNIAYWMDEFHVDGFRLDATHAIADNSEIHILKQAAAVAHSRGCFVIAEDDRNDPKLVSEPQTGGLGIDGCWADDFHHVVNVMLTGKRDSYFKNYEGTADELATVLERGWLFTGQTQKTTGKPRGGDPSSLRPEQLVYCISNHDQVGNRAFGERFSHLISPAAFRAASALLLLSPYTPLIFMGQEWSASTPFLFFTDHEPALGEKIIFGRRREFRDFAGFRDANFRETIPSPQDEQTFLRSKLDWSERDQPQRAAVISLYRKCLQLRKTLPALRNRSRDNWRVLRLHDRIPGIVYGAQTNDCCIVVTDLKGIGFSIQDIAQAVGLRADLKLLFSSNANEFAGGNDTPDNQPATILLQKA